MNERKPIKDYTLGEVSEICSGIEDCEKEGCPFFSQEEVIGTRKHLLCRFLDNPSKWDLTEKTIKDR